MVSVRTVAICLALLSGALGIGGAPSAAAEEGTDHAQGEHRIVGVTHRALHPEVQLISEAHTFGWLNYTRNVIRVSFDAGVAQKLFCESRSTFRLVGDRLRSGNIATDDFATLCRLAPGEYPYRVELIPNGPRIERPGTILHGKLISE